MKTIAEILDTIKELKGLKTDMALAEMLNIERGTVSNWKQRGTIPFDLIVSFCEQEGLSLDKLLLGKTKEEDNLVVYGLAPASMGEDDEMTYMTNRGPMVISDICKFWGIPVLEFDKRVAEQNKTQTIANPRAGYDAAPQKNISNFVFVPIVSGEISAGGGLLPNNNIEMRVAFRRDWIQRRGDPNNMSLIRVSGDSMEPTLMSGDLVLIDHNRNFIDPQGGIYAIAMNGTIMIKRLQAIYPSKTVRVISDNAKYSYLEAESDQLTINGKVIWFGREIER
ncbi:MAG: hypothetical protein EPN22_16840 [Nitrospirae bacterium]|nr:MAG: hypothetical protein EPN22_16840 [Nitrospirota bacterium]